MKRSNRSAKILDLVHNSNREHETLQSLSVPRYETTKGTGHYERQIYFGAIHSENLENLSPSKLLQEHSVTSSWKKRKLPKRKSVNGAKRKLNLEYQDIHFHKSFVADENITSSINSDSNTDSGDEYIPSENSSENDDDEVNIHKCQNSGENKNKIQDNKCFDKNMKNKLQVKEAFDITTNLEEESLLPEKISGNETNLQLATDIATNFQENRLLPIPAYTNVGDTTENSNIELVKSDIEEVTVSVVKRNMDGKRCRDKRHCCYICNKLLSNNMARHFELKHGNDIQVAKILALPKGSKSRRDELETLIRAGDFYYNCNVLAIKDGELILVRRPDVNKQILYRDFGPCSYCLGFMSKKYLWHHLRECKMKKGNNEDNEGRRGPLNESAAMLFEILGPKTDENFRHNIISSFRVDSISEACKEDILIVKLGSFLFEKYGNSQAELIRQSMRQLGRLKLELKQYTEKKVLSEWIAPQYFDDIIMATKNICGNEIGHLENNFKIPSFALKIGHLLRKCVALESGSALRKGLIQRHNELKAFNDLMDLEWSVRVSSKALTTLQKRKMNTTQLLPITSDLMKLNLYLKEQLKYLKVLIEKTCTRQVWSNLASVTLCRIILFNKRRSGEAARMTLSNYSNRPSWSEQGTDEFKNSLTPLELELANRLTMLQIIGKRGRIVPVILTEDMKSSIDLLIKYRSQADISSKNTFIFARSQNSEGHLRGHDCLRKECLNSCLQYAENITSTKLRKYIATVCQIFNLTENETDWLARHLGHDIRVHRDFYRLHESAVELTKVSRLLLAVDKGEAEKYSGKKLTDINIEELPPLEEDEEEANDCEDIPYAHDERTQVEDVFEPEEKKKPKIVNKGTKKDHRWVPWSKEELSAVVKYFKIFIKMGKLPGKKDCNECIDKNEILKTRKWTDIKFCIKNQITRNKRALHSSK